MRTSNESGRPGDLSPALPGLNDYRAILHAHAEDSSHTGGTRAEMLSEAKNAGVDAIFLSDHHRPPRDFMRDSWRGLRDGVLFVPGSEAGGFLLYPSRSIMEHMNDPTAALIEATRSGDGLISRSLPHSLDQRRRGHRRTLGKPNGLRSPGSGSLPRRGLARAGRRRAWLGLLESDLRDASREIRKQRVESRLWWRRAPQLSIGAGTMPAIRDAVKDTAAIIYSLFSTFYPQCGSPPAQRWQSAG